jgi:inner membrane protein
MKNLKSNIFFKIGVIIILTLILLIPTTLVQGLIHERENVQSEAINEVSSKWGNSQTVTGPFISIPYKKYVKRVENDSVYFRTVKEWAHFLPEQLTINGDVAPEKKHRGIFDVVVYQSILDVEGEFKTFDFDELGVLPKDVLYDQATLNVGVSDLRGIETQIGLNWNNKESFFKPGTSTDDIVESGINANVIIDSKDSINYNFNLKLDLKGSQKLYFVPVGKTTDVHLTSSWTSPKFTGSFLTDKNTVNDSGFVADWKILNLNRNYPQSWINSNYQVSSSKFGTELLLPVDGYTKSYRVARYSILFIVLTFMVFFFVEVMNKVFIHPIQYLLVGIALVVFYTLLLSFSEHIVFNWAYIIAAALTLTLITGYTLAIIKSKVVTVLISGILAILYTFIFIIIQMEDFALLIGSIGIFLILGFVMYFSRKIDWYNIKMGKEVSNDLLE